MNKRVVRVKLPDGIHALNDDVRVLVLHRCGDGVCFDLTPPAGVDARVWASHLTEASNFNVIVALEWPHEARWAGCVVT